MPALQVPVYPQGAPPPLTLEDVQKQAKTRAILDGVDTAEGQQRLPLYRLQHKTEPDLIANAEKAQADTLKQMRAKWLAPPLRLAFETAYRRTLADPSYRARALLFADKPDLATDPQPSAFDPFLLIGYVVVGGAAILVVGGLLAGWFRVSGMPKTPLKLGRGGEQPQQTSDTYGTADYAAPRATIPDPLYVFNGVFFGKSSTPGAEHVPFERDQGAPICSTPENHSLVIARTRTGKGTRVVIPTLLRYLTGSALVIDPKGENAAVTARARMTGIPGYGSTVHIINPWGELDRAFKGLSLPYATYNPLDILRKDDPNAVGIAQDLAAAICPVEKTGKDAFWNQAAASILTAVLLWLTDKEGEQKTLGRAREIVTKSKKDFQEQFLVPMGASPAFSGAIRENAAPFIGMAQETYSGVMSNLAQHTAFLSDPQIKAATATSSFFMSDLMKRSTTVYLVIPPSKMNTQRTWLRLLITAGMQTYKRYAHPNAVRCLFLIDEFAALGRLDEIPRDIATMSGYGVDFCLIVQGIDQLKTVYGDAHTSIVNNCAYKWFCNVNDLHSAEYLSKTLGNKTVQTTSTSSSDNMGPAHGSGGQSTSHGQTGRALLMPDEVLNLGRDTAILLAPGSKPLYLRPIDYWKLPEAFIRHSQVYPHMYWEPPLKWDENPLPH